MLFQGIAFLVNYNTYQDIEGVKSLPVDESMWVTKGTTYGDIGAVDRPHTLVHVESLRKADSRLV